jgi:hypothetical protein
MGEQNTHRNRGVPDAPRSVPRGEDSMDVRCDCGSLMARVTTSGIELKCRRCKRVVLVATNDARRGWVTVALHRDEGVMR